MRKSHMDKCLNHWCKVKWKAGNEMFQFEGILKQAPDGSFNLHPTGKLKYMFDLDQVVECRIIR